MIDNDDINNDTEQIINVHEIYENAMKDPELFSKIDIEHLLDCIDNEKSDYLENKTMKSVSHDIFFVINRLKITMEQKEGFCQKLSGYRHVDEIRELHKGKHIRWIRYDMPEKMTNGAIITNIKFLDNGTQVLCKNSQNRFIQIKFDECHIFQKLTMEEQLILMAYEYMEQTV